MQVVPGRSWNSISPHGLVHAIATQYLDPTSIKPHKLDAHPSIRSIQIRFIRLSKSQPQTLPLSPQPCLLTDRKYRRRGQRKCLGFFENGLVGLHQ